MCFDLEQNHSIENPVKINPHMLIYLQEVKENSNENLANPVSLGLEESSDCLGSKSNWDLRGKLKKNLYTFSSSF